ncbi:beta-hexosaminidase [Adhaeribacter aerolatus]|uniref:beta-N-acetylhexosaminidase n=2 Tax=Adhaeribacter aerolatus TaxID=670289 RepID=A0A512AUV2_9BACT|nr:beta-hexosaminidase [Adhaeribacter aerolatus]
MTIPILTRQAKNTISLELKKAKNARPEAYYLAINASGTQISAAAPHGVFNGVNSLLQLIRQAPVQAKNITLSGWEITDAPALAWRGVMLDESRFFFGKETVKEILDWMAFYKLNRFHWHLTDTPGWRLEIKSYPRLALVGGVGNHGNPDVPAQYYTQEDIKEIVSYAAERFIEVIPEIDMPGHAAAANRAYPEFSGGGSERYPEFTFNPGKEETYGYLTRILKEVDVLFPAKKIHLGGDEVHFGNKQWQTNQAVQQLMQAQKLPDLKAVEFYFIQRMTDSLSKLNSKILAWDEVVSAALPVKNTIIFWWRHDQPQQLKLALEKGYQTVLCPRIPFYLDFVQDSSHFSGRRWKGDYSSLEKLYNFSTAAFPGIITEKNKNLVAGIQAALWTETISSKKRLEFMLFPRISALAEAAWTPPGSRNFGTFKTRLTKHLELYRQQDIYFYNPLQPASRPEVIDIFENKPIE